MIPPSEYSEFGEWLIKKGYIIEKLSNAELNDLYQVWFDEGAD